MKHTVSTRMVLMWVLIPAANFFTWYFIGHTSTSSNINAGSSCLPNSYNVKVATSSSSSGRVLSDSASTLMQNDTAIPFCPEDDDVAKMLKEEVAKLGITGPYIGANHPFYNSCSPHVLPKDETVNLYEVDTKSFDSWRVAQLADLISRESLKGGQNGFMDTTFIIKPDRESECTSYKWFVRDYRKCAAVVRIHNMGPATYGPLRFETDIDEHNLRISTFEKLFGENGEYKKKNPKPWEELFVGNEHNKGRMRPVGLFRKVPKDRGHKRTQEKLGPFVRHFGGANGIEQQLRDLLNNRGFRPGDDIVAMAINEGEVDLFLNFACSCHLHNITLSNVLVFAGSR
jgi:hypothetical protein